MAAEKRRPNHLPTFNTVLPTQSSVVKSQAATPSQKATPQIIEEESYFKQDLTKSIMISAVIFLLEVGIYFNTQFGFIPIKQFFHF
jgi:hypothetical protein